MAGKDVLSPAPQEAGVVTLPFPHEFNWKSPSPDFQRWIDHIQSHVRHAYFDVFQEYERGERPQGFEKWSHGMFAVRLEKGPNGKPEYGFLYPYFGDEFRNWDNNHEYGDWRYFIHKLNTVAGIIVRGGGYMHFSELERNYVSGFSIEFDSGAEMNRFFDLLTSQDPRKVIELYIVGKLGRAVFPQNEDAISTYDRELFYPFSSQNGPLEVRLRK